jgi:hypothetical protein
MRTPVKDPSHRFSCTSHLKQLIPPKSVVHSYLLYGGYTELQLAGANRFVCAHTNNLVIAQFWECLLENPEYIHTIVTQMAPKFKDPAMHPVLQNTWMTYSDEYIRAALFFILNRRSSTGALSSGDIEEAEINPLALHDLKTFRPPHFYVLYEECQDFLEKFPGQAHSDHYHLFPVGNFSYNLFEYGKNKGVENIDIDHQELAARVRESDVKTVLIYKNHPHLFNLYKDFNIHLMNQHGKPTKRSSHCAEVIIANF